ncbi:YbjN domain-containing protein [uncultured Desulfovibrio sp.]|uniref:YbjN domain-containing protein n=1 Tax=uncultured Desulfovibrio sp. TaxID=167968 RepID=UPI002634E21F|nr:YbjN domain-containing protein [uncultured Desulfovibrio sp.]
MKAEQIMHIMTQHGFAPELDEDGDIAFTSDDVDMNILLDAEDPDYISLGASFTGFGPAEQEAVYGIAAALSQSFKVGKAIVFDDDDSEFEVRFAVEAFVTPESLDRDLDRYVSLVQDMIAEFFDVLNGEDAAH